MAGISDAFISYMMSLLDYFKSFTGNYGWAIILFAGLVKAVLYYPTQSQYKSMKEMQKVQPELKKLQDRYKKDPQKLQMEQMALFKKHNVNPMGGCLPIIIQMPILIGIFATIRKMAELGKFANETFLWIGGPLSNIYPRLFGESLARPDILLLLIYGVSMFLSQKMTTTQTSDEGTQKMMTTIMPVMFTFLLWRFPAALILYWLVFNILSIVQQYITMRDTSTVTFSHGKDAGQVADIDDSGNEGEEEESPTAGRARSRSRKRKGGN